MTELTADFSRALPGGGMDDSTYEAIESALDSVGAPLTDKPLSAGGRFLTLAERVFALEAERVAALRRAPASPAEQSARPRDQDKSNPQDQNNINLLVAEWDVISAKARSWAAIYREGSDGRNTFILFAEWVERRAAEALSQVKGGETASRTDSAGEGLRPFASEGLRKSEGGA